MHEYLKLGIKIDLTGGGILFLLLTFQSWFNMAFGLTFKMFLYSLPINLIVSLIFFIPISLIIILVKHYKNKKNK